MPDLLLGIDVGTSSVKAGVFAPDGRLLGLSRCAYRTESPRTGWAQCDPEQWWRSMANAVRQARAAAKAHANDIGVVGLSVLFPAVAPLDARGRALYPAILYCDRRSVEQVRAIERAIPREEYQAITGNVLVPGTCAATSIAWLRDNAPAAYAKASTIGFANTFMCARLTGRFVCDPTMAALSGLADVTEPRRWSESLCRRLDLDRARLPEIVASTQVVGEVTKAAADAAGLSAGTPVVCGCGDAPASAAGAGALAETTIAYMAGSTDCMTVPMKRPSPELLWVNCAYVPRDTWLGIGTTMSSGVSVAWFAREVLGLDGPAGLEQMTRLAGASPPGSNDLLFLPYLQGERTPVWDAHARGLFIGLTSETTRADMARAVFEGTAFALRHVLECCPVRETTVKEIRAVGGGTGNALWNQIKADVLGRPIDVLQFQETSARGAALLGGVGIGLFGSFDDAIAVARRAGATETVEPNPERSALYQERYALYKRLHPAIQDIAHTL